MVVIITNNTFLFYDLETTGTDFAFDRILQFAGIRLDMNLNQIGEPINFYVALEEGVYPSPGATLVTKIIPRRTPDPLSKVPVLSEYDAATFLHDEVFTPGTIAVGYNNIAFDDRFISHLFYRNFYDPYEWQFRDGRGKWDIFKITPFIAALRPDSIKWPLRADGQRSFKLEDLAIENNIEQTTAHDAISDVEALIGLTKLFREKQPKIYQYLFDSRDKNSTAEIIKGDSGRSIFVSANGVADNPFRVSIFANITGILNAKVNSNELIVYNAAIDPDTFADLDENALAQLFSWQVTTSDDVTVRPPLGTFLLNRCTPVAPLNVVTDEVAERIGVSSDQALKNYQKFLSLCMNNRGNNSLASRLAKAYFNARNSRPPSRFGSGDKIDEKITTFRSSSADGKLYGGGFIPPLDKRICNSVHNATAADIASIKFSDARYNEKLLEFRRKYYADTLGGSDLTASNDLLTKRKAHGKAKFAAELASLESDTEALSALTETDARLLQTLKQYVSEN